MAVTKTKLFKFTFALYVTPLTFLCVVRRLQHNYFLLYCYLNKPDLILVERAFLCIKLYQIYSKVGSNQNQCCLANEKGNISFLNSSPRMFMFIHENFKKVSFEKKLNLYKCKSSSYARGSSISQWLYKNNASIIQTMSLGHRWAF